MASEIARLRAQIDQEIAAMRLGLDGYAVVSKHAFINHRFEQLGKCIERLRPQIGEQKAVEMVMDALEKGGVIDR